VHREFNILKAFMFYRGLSRESVIGCWFSLFSCSYSSFTEWQNRVQRPSSSGDDWPMFLHDPSHTGQTASAGPTEPVELWRFRVSDLLQRIHGYSPKVDGGVVYVRSSDWGELYALDALTGDLKWESPGSLGVRVGCHRWRCGLQRHQ
jgi:hypothetical protein